MIDDDRMAGVAELMNYPGVFLGAKSELAKIEAGKGKAIDGHAPGLRGKNLNAYALAGVRSDHESVERGGGAGETAARHAHPVARGQHGTESRAPAPAYQRAQLAAIAPSPRTTSSRAIS